jgi:hypothetical protein
MVAHVHEAYRRYRFRVYAVYTLRGLVRTALLCSWPAFDFVPKALAFERAEPSAITEIAGRDWTCRSMLRLTLDLVTCGAVLAAFAVAAQLTGAEP